MVFMNIKGLISVKKLMALALVLIALVGVAAAEDIDFDSYTLEELRDMQQRISAAISGKQNEVAQPAESVEGAPLRDLFEDVELAKLVRDAMGAFSVNDIVTQDQLDAVTELRVPGGAMLSSIGGISHLRGLVTLSFGASVATAYGPERRISDPEYASLLCTELPDEIGQLTNLRYLKFCQTRFERFPDSMRNLVNLESLFVRGAALKELPDWIGEWTNLKKLEVWQCFVDAVPASIGELVNLTELPNNT